MSMHRRAAPSISAAAPTAARRSDGLEERPSRRRPRRPRRRGHAHVVQLERGRLAGRGPSLTFGVERQPGASTRDRRGHVVRRAVPRRARRDQDARRPRAPTARSASSRSARSRRRRRRGPQRRSPLGSPGRSRPRAAPGSPSASPLGDAGQPARHLRSVAAGHDRRRRPGRRWRSTGRGRRRGRSPRARAPARPCRAPGRRAPRRWRAQQAQLGHLLPDRLARSRADRPSGGAPSAGVLSRRGTRAPRLRSMACSSGEVEVHRVRPPCSLQPVGAQLARQLRARARR